MGAWSMESLANTFTSPCYCIWCRGSGHFRLSVIISFIKLHSIFEMTLFHLDFSFRHTPPFGRDTIRRFSTNVSGLKRLAARDFEDILLVIF
jgi:hypothetical protein